MIMDWNSHINVEYNGFGYCVQCLYKYLFKGQAQRERFEMYSEQEHDSHDEIKLWKNSSSTLFFWNPLVMASTATKYRL
jgi:hypothetical protein